MNKQLKNKLVELVHYIKEWIFRFQYLSFSRPKNVPQMGIAMVDGRKWHGGMCDRFKGIISAYHYCQEHGIDFKIYYVYPFNISEYLIPNEYNWYINNAEIPNSIWNVRPFLGLYETGRRLLKLNTKKHLWFYGNRDLSLTVNTAPYNDDWGKTFKKLFRPSNLLNKSIEKIRNQIGNKYIAVVYRFQNLLGDFMEYNYQPLSKKEAQFKLVERAVRELSAIHNANPGIKVLVTSDSSTFLEEVKNLEYVFVIPGQISHMDSSGKDVNHSQLKSFLDFYMISGAEKVYSVVINQMYRSEFPEYAAKLNNVPFERLEYNEEL